MLWRAKDKEFSEKHRKELLQFFWAHLGKLCINLSDEPAKRNSLHIELTPKPHPVRVKLRNYSEKQRNFLRKLLSNIIQHNCMYPNLSLKWASAPLIVPKPRPDGRRFTIDLHPVNQFTIRHHLSMPILDPGLVKVLASCVYAGFDFSHSYWQLMLHYD